MVTGDLVMSLRFPFGPWGNRPLEHMTQKQVEDTMHCKILHHSLHNTAVKTIYSRLSLLENKAVHGSPARPRLPYEQIPARWLVSNLLIIVSWQKLTRVSHAPLIRQILHFTAVDNVLWRQIRGRISDVFFKLRSLVSIIIF